MNYEVLKRGLGSWVRGGAEFDSLSLSLSLLSPANPQLC